MIKNRSDITPYLIHWCKNDRFDYDEAFQCLLNILISEKLIASSELIMGKHHVICFSEAPIKEVVRHHHGKYLPFGIAYLKKTIFEKGGRPVIYQTKEEYSKLPIDLQWRHVSYNPSGDSPCDFTWEREWRINVNELQLDPSEMLLVLPDSSWKDRLIKKYAEQQSDKNYMYEMLAGAGCGFFPEEPQYCIMDLNH